MDPNLIIKELIAKNPKTKKELNNFKKEIAIKTHSSFFPSRKLLNYYLKYTTKNKLTKDKELISLLKTGNVRSISGVTVITVSTKPYKCPGECIYCPQQKNIPKSYLDNEPAIMRAQRNNFNAYKQTKERLTTLIENGHETDKIEIIVVGGTWSYLPKKYQTKFIKNCFDACNQKFSFTLKQAQKINETAKHRIVGLTVETRPDYIDEKEIIQLRKLGVTRVEIGVQTIYDEILKFNKRGHLKKETIKATQLLKDAGLKVCYHIMPNLPKSNFQIDIQLIKDLFEKQEYQPDMLKIYPCMVLKEAPLYELYKNNEYKSYTDEELVDLLTQYLQIIPYYCRVQRMIRDIPTPSIVSGSKISNLREVIENKSRKEELNIKEIRYREVKDNFNENEIPQMFIQKYNASNGIEYFLSFENKSRTIIYSILRLRFPSSKNHFLKELNNAALIREVHTYGRATELHKQTLSAQHKGLGSKLLNKAEQIAKENKYNKIAVISGIGVRKYYTKFGYKLEGSYMIKNI